MHNNFFYVLQIAASKIDFYDSDEFGYLRYLEEEDDYPPRFTIEVDGSSATKADVLCVSFKGATEEFKIEKILTFLHKQLSGKHMCNNNILVIVIILLLVYVTYRISKP